MTPINREGPAGLTRREVEVLRLLARGLSKKEIAEGLVLAPKTVGTHVEHVLCRRVVEHEWRLTKAAAEVSVRTARKRVRRYLADGEAGLLDRSSAPHYQPTRPVRVACRRSRSCSRARAHC